MLSPPPKGQGWDHIGLVELPPAFPSWCCITWETLDCWSASPLTHRLQKPVCSGRMACCSPGDVCLWVVTQDLHYSVSWAALWNLWA